MCYFATVVEDTMLNVGAVMSLFGDDDLRGCDPVQISEDQLALFEDDPELLTVVEDLPAVMSEPSYKTWKDVPLPIVEEIFEVWQDVHLKKRAVLSQDRLRAISKAIVDFGRETVLHAIHGASLSPWHMGKNPSGRKYNDISLILRNAEKIEGFAEIWLDRRSAGGFLDER